MICVTDTGTGIDPQLLPRLFQPFSQGSTTLARTGGGLGLGLALVKALVDLHGGRVEAHSDGPGRGATFTVRLPLQDAVRPAHRARPTAVATRRWRILLVEDNSDAAWSLARGARARWARRRGRDDAARRPSTRRGSPSPNSCSATSACPRWTGTRSPAASAPTRSSPHAARGADRLCVRNDRSHATAAGFDAHLAKPLRMDELAQVLGSFEASRDLV
jgi:hypothetical protein